MVDSTERTTGDISDDQSDALADDTADDTADDREPTQAGYEESARSQEPQEPLRFPPLTRKDVVRRVVIGLALVAAVAGIYFTGRAATTGLDSTSESLPSSVDRLIPSSGDEVLRQAQVGIDVSNGFDAYLIVNGVEVRTPQDGLIKDLGTGQVLVQPGEGKVVKSLNEGKNCVVAMVWETIKTEATASPVSWCFDAT